MIERFYNPSSGKIRIDDMTIDKINIREFRRVIGYVGQEPVMFNTSIRENLLFANPDATE
jgi:ABC-type multidrug transport system fused ATPase/permease subunit